MTTPKEIAESLLGGTRVLGSYEATTLATAYLELLEERDTFAGDRATWKERALAAEERLARAEAVVEAAKVWDREWDIQLAAINAEAAKIPLEIPRTFWEMTEQEVALRAALTTYQGEASR